MRTAALQLRTDEEEAVRLVKHPQRLMLCSSERQEFAFELDELTATLSSGPNNDVPAGVIELRLRTRKPHDQYECSVDSALFELRDGSRLAIGSGWQRARFASNTAEPVLLPLKGVYGRCSNAAAPLLEVHLRFRYRRHWTIQSPEHDRQSVASLLALHGVEVQQLCVGANEQLLNDVLKYVDMPSLPLPSWPASVDLLATTERLGLDWLWKRLAGELIRSRLQPYNRRLMDAATTVKEPMRRRRLVDAILLGVKHPVVLDKISAEFDRPTLKEHCWKACDQLSDAVGRRREQLLQFGLGGDDVVQHEHDAPVPLAGPTSEHNVVLHFKGGEQPIEVNMALLRVHWPSLTDWRNKLNERKEVVVDFLNSIYNDSVCRALPASYEHLLLFCLRNKLSAYRDYVEERLIEAIERDEVDLATTTALLSRHRLPNARRAFKRTVGRSNKLPPTSAAYWANKLTERLGLRAGERDKAEKLLSDAFDEPYVEQLCRPAGRRPFRKVKADDDDELDSTTLAGQFSSAVVNCAAG